MGNDDAYVSLGLKVWKAQIEQAGDGEAASYQSVTTGSPA